MAALLFRLRNVPDDEAAEVRTLLDTHNIEFYETTAGNWGISMPGIWLEDESDMPRARALLDEYQASRQQQMRAEYEAQRRIGQAPGLIDALRQKPLLSLLVFAFSLFVMYVMISPILRMIRYTQ